MATPQQIDEMVDRLASEVRRLTPNRQEALTILTITLISFFEYLLEDWPSQRSDIQAAIEDVRKRLQEIQRITVH